MKGTSFSLLLVTSFLLGGLGTTCLAEDAKERMTLQETAASTWQVAFSPDGKTLASAGSDAKIRLWEVATGKLTIALEGHDGEVTSVAFGPDGKSLASAGGKDKSIKIWDVKTGKNTSTLTGHTDGLCCVLYSPDGKSLASASADRSIKLWDVKSGQCIATLKGHQTYATSLAFSPDSKTLGSVGCRIDSETRDTLGEVKLWDVATGRNTKNLEGHNGNVRGLAFSPDGKLLATASQDRSGRLWDTQTGKVAAILRDEPDNLDDHLFAVAFSPDGKTVALAGNTRGTIKLWDVETGRRTAMLPGHLNCSVYSLAFSPDGKILASGGVDKAIKLWDIPAANKK